MEWSLAALKIGLLLVIALNGQLSVTEGHRILVTGTQVLSQVGRQVALAEELASRGHHVYLAIASRYPKLNDLQVKGIKPITFHVPDDVLYFGTGDMDTMTSSLFYNHTANEVAHLLTKKMPMITTAHCKCMMEDKAFLGALAELKFDLAVVHTFILGMCPLLLPKHLQIPFVQLSPFVFPWDVRIPALPSTIITPTLWPISSLNSIENRLENLLLYLGIQFSILYQVDTSLLHQHVPGISTWAELERESELLIIDNNYILDDCVPLPTHVITVPGLTAKPAKPLPEEFQHIMNSHTNGVIVMTLGSVAGKMPDDIIIKYFQAFSRLKQTILVKSDAPKGHEIPPNVKLFPWLPQNDLLGHPNTRLFITHCGNHGQFEAVYQGVPMLGFPIFAEQRGNCLRAQRKGYGLCMDIRDFTADNLYDNIMEMINNEKYSKATKKASEIIQAEPMNAREKAAYWIEHVIRFGSEHLKSDSLHMPLYQYFMLDILLLLFIGLFTVSGLSLVILIYIIKKCKKSFQKEAIKPKTQ